MASPPFVLSSDSRMQAAAAADGSGVLIRVEVPGQWWAKVWR